jgi:hypothetical protein
MINWLLTLKNPWPIVQPFISVIYLHRTYGYSYRELVQMTVQAKREFDPNKRDEFFEASNANEQLFMISARKQMDESDQYACVNGCCTIIWSRGKYAGGMGRTGCPCDEMDDPRDLLRGKL